MQIFVHFFIQLLDGLLEFPHHFFHSLDPQIDDVHHVLRHVSDVVHHVLRSYLSEVRFVLLVVQNRFDIGRVFVRVFSRPSIAEMSSDGSEVARSRTLCKGYALGSIY